MYQILLGDINGNNSILYYPGDLECMVYDTKLNLQVGSAGTFDMKVPAANPLCSSIKQGAIVTILRDDSEFWRGEVQETSKDFLGNLDVYCVEDLSWLGLEPLVPGQITNQTYAQRFQSAIETYNNNQTGTEKLFEVGYITNVISSNNCKWSIEYEYSVLDGIRECIASSDGYVRIRRENGNRYVDVVKLEDFGVSSTQTIRFAENLLDYVEEMDMNNLTNYLVPYGAETEEELFTDVFKRIEGTVVEDSNSIELYGRHARSVIFETESVEKLNALAQAYITRYSQPQLKFTLKAVDLAEISDESYFNIGDSIRVIAEPFGIDQWVYLTSQTIDLQDVSKNSFSLSSYITRGRTLTEQTASAAELVEEIPSKSSLLESARKNALNLLEGASGGYVTYKFNSSGQPVEIRIMDNIEEDQSLKKWVWNENGLGYMTRTSTSEEFQPSNVSVALTMDGQILARTGVIGSDNSAWNIGSHSIYNGTTSMTDSDNDGLYIGTDGIRSVGTGALGYKVYTSISGGKIKSTSLIEASTLKGSVTATNGASGNFSVQGYVDGEMRYIGLNITNGIVTGIS